MTCCIILNEVAIRNWVYCSGKVMDFGTITLVFRYCVVGTKGSKVFGENILVLFLVETRRDESMF